MGFLSISIRHGRNSLNHPGKEKKTINLKIKQKSIDEVVT